MDFSTVRLVLELENAADVPTVLLVRDAPGGSSAVVNLRVGRGVATTTAA
jgi:hypothetical protein